MVDRVVDAYMLQHPEITSRADAQDAWLRENEHLCSTTCIDPVISDAADILRKRWGWL